MAGTYTDEQRAEAVHLALEHGPTEASNRTGIHKATISRWMTPQQRAERAQRSQAKTAAATEAHRRKWQELSATMADRSGDLAARVLDLVADHLDDLVPETAADVKNLATAAGILIDKAQLLAGLATSRTEATISDQRQVLAEADEVGLRLVSNG